MSKNLENLVRELQRGLAAPLRLLDMMSENLENLVREPTGCTANLKGCA
jgi:hypothetical protein